MNLCRIVISCVILELVGCSSNTMETEYKFDNRNQSFIGVVMSSTLSERENAIFRKLASENDYIKLANDFPSSDEEKVSAFKVAAASNIPNLWGVRGGYGSYRLIEPLSKVKLKKNKTFIGYSDLTALNIYLSQNTNWKVIHGPIMLDLAKNLGQKYESLDLLSDIIANNISYSINVTPINKENLPPIKGKITGGNLTLVEGTIGTKNEIKTDNKIVFLEVVNIHSQYFYRSMYHLYAARKFDKVRAIIIGSMNRNYPNPHYIETLHKLAKIIKAPIFVTDKIGHGITNVPIIYNSNTVIKGNQVYFNCPK